MESIVGIVSALIYILSPIDLLPDVAGPLGYLDNVDFEFRQCGTYTIKAGKQYKIQIKDLCKQARLANIDYKKQ
ncbi:MAG: YkvA family protein [Bacilli bacterium]